MSEDCTLLSRAGTRSHSKGARALVIAPAWAGFPLPSKDSYSRLFGPKDPILEKAFGLFWC